MMHNLTKKAVLLILLLVVGGIALSWQKDLPLEYLKSKYANEESEFVKIDGMEIHLRDEGNSADTLPIVLVHGTGASLHTWDGWVKALLPDRRVIRLDLPAYGLTGANPTGDYSTKTYATLIAKILDTRNIRRCVIAGNSLGGTVSWRFAESYPEKTARLILVDAGGYSFKPKDQPIAFKLAKIPVVNQLFKYVTPKFVVEKSVRNVFVQQDKVTPEMVERYYDLTLRAGNRAAFVERMSKLNFGEDTLAISKIKIPTLILWGKDDLLIPVEMAYKFQRDLPNDTLVVMPNLGHVPMEEAPEASVAIVKTFLKKR